MHDRCLGESGSSFKYCDRAVCNYYQSLCREAAQAKPKILDQRVARRALVAAFCSAKSLPGPNPMAGLLLATFPVLPLALSSTGDWPSPPADGAGGYARDLFQRAIMATLPEPLRLPGVLDRGISTLACGDAGVG